jgi:hypothetical protein
MSCITQILAVQGDKAFLPVNSAVVVEGGGIYKKHEYIITFTDAGHRCGYVAVDPIEQRWLVKNKQKDDLYFFPDLSCHGGVTFFEDDHAAKRLIPIHCDDFWIGFDAAHYQDSPDYDLRDKYFADQPRLPGRQRIEHVLEGYGATHKTFAFMEENCKHIIDQLLKRSAE